MTSTATGQAPEHADAPYFGYIYRPDGYYHGPDTIADDAALQRYLRATAAPAVRAGREVRITDCLDCLIFHATDGKILWP